MTREQTLEERISYFKDDAQDAINSFYAETLQEVVIESLDIIKELQEELRQKDKWQLIATAPKDGTKILTICGNISSVRAWGVDEDDEEKWLPRIRGVFPTHWMPLPKLNQLNKNNDK